MGILRKFKYIRTKAEANYRLKQIYKVLRGDQLFCRFTKRLVEEMGADATLESVDDDMLISIDPTQSFIPCIVHECLHIVMNSDDEVLIGRMEQELMHWITSRQCNNLYKRTYDAFARQM